MTKRTRLLPILLLVAACLAPAAAAAACKPLIVFYSGFSSKWLGKDKMLAEVCEEYERPGATIWCQSWNAPAIDWIRRHWRSTPEPTPIVLIGHSYGGDTAYDVARSLSRSMKPTLITLDPVSEDAWSTVGIPMLIGVNWRDDEMPKPTHKKWINVYRKARNWNFWIGGSLQVGGPGACDDIARFGGMWGRQHNATSIRFDGTHCEARAMFNRVRSVVRDATACLDR